MMSTDKKLSQLIINKLTQEQFDNITPSNDELYLVEETSNYATVEQLTTKQDIITDLDEIRSGASLGSTAIQQVKTINGESIVGSGNIEIKSGVDITYDFMNERMIIGG